MRSHARAGGTALLVLLVAFGGGCELALKYGSVSGTVKVDGQPVAGLTVTFLPPKGTPVAATTDDKGFYTAVNVPVGSCMVGVTSPESGTADVPGMPEKNRGALSPDDLARQQAKEAADKAKKKPKLPERYTDPSTSQLTVNVIEGETKFDIPVTTK